MGTAASAVSKRTDVLAGRMLRERGNGWPEIWMGPVPIGKFKTYL